MPGTRLSQNPTWQLLDENGDIIVTVNNNTSVAPVIGDPHIGMFDNVKKVSITSAQLLALKATPITLLAAPLDTKYSYVIHDISYHYVAGTTAYTLNAGTLRAFYGPVANANPVHADVANGLITVTSNRNILGVPAIKTTTDTDAHLLNQPILLANDGAAEFTLGNGTLTVVFTFAFYTIA